MASAQAHFRRSSGQAPPTRLIIHNHDHPSACRPSRQSRGRFLQRASTFACSASTIGLLFPRGPTQRFRPACSFRSERASHRGANDFSTRYPGKNKPQCHDLPRRPAVDRQAAEWSRAVLEEAQVVATSGTAAADSYQRVSPHPYRRDVVQPTPLPPLR